MEFFRRILQIMDTGMERPEAYGWFHLLWLVIVGALVVLAVICGRNASEKTVRKIVLCTALVVIALEIYKQLNYTFGDGSSAPRYQWYAFPFQFCSTPMYVGLLAGLTRKGKFHDSLCAYLATYALFAGTCVMFYPGDVFISTVGINIQTMICHGSMPVIAALLYASGHVRLEWKTICRALPIFLTGVGIAAVLNEVAYLTGILENHTFNMFFISPHCAPSLAVYSLVQAVLPFPLCLIVYVLGFTAAASLMLLLAMGLSRAIPATHARPAHHRC